MITLRFSHRLSTESWTAALRKLSSVLLKSDATDLTGTDVHIDLSTVGFADFVILGRLLILVDALTAERAAVIVRLPTGEPLDGESAQDSEVARRQRQRHNCRLFLRQSGFEPALHQGPLRAATLKVVEGVERRPDGTAAASPALLERGKLEAQRLPHRQRKLLPYQWLPPAFGAGLTRSTRATPLETALRGLGLPSEDSVALARGVLAELIENVAEHAQPVSGRPAMALVGGVMIEPTIYASWMEDFPRVLREFAGWAAQVPSPLIRLVVADSGRGLFATLPPPTQPRDNDTTSVSPSDKLTAPDTLLTVFAHGKNHPTGTGARAGSQGLSKVERIVRGYRGSIVLSTGSHMAGRIFGTSPQGSSVTEACPGWMPGTFIECNILARTDSDTARVEGESLTPPRYLAGGRPDLLCTTVALHPGDDGLNPADLKRIEKIVAGQLGPVASGLIIAVDTPGGGDRPSDTAIGDCLKAIQRLINKAPAIVVALVFPNINRRLLRLAIEDLNDDLDAESQQQQQIGWGSPVLVLAPDSRHYWVAATPEARRVLRALSSASAPVKVTDLPSGDGSARHTSVIRQLRDRTRLLAKRHDTFRLLLSPQDALDAVSNDVAERLGRAIITANCDAVQRGLFLTPSLRKVNRWCDIPALLSELNAERLVGFALAARVESRGLGTGTYAGHLDPEPPTAILWLGRPNHELVSTFARSLTGVDEYFDSVGSLRLERVNGTASPVNRVLLVTDLISSGTTIAHAVAELAERNLVVDAVAAVVDARDARSPHVHQTEIVIRAHRLPLISLVAINIEPDQQEQTSQPLVPIDPMLGRPDANRRHQPRCLLSQDDYIEVLKRTRAARLGHILRPAGRHYTAYVDPTLLFSDHRWSRKAIGRLRRKVAWAHRTFTTDPANAGICIIHPAETHDDIAQVAQSLRADLEAAGLPFAGTVVVPRAALGNRWGFPASIPVPARARHLVLLDSATGRGHTIQQLIRLSALPSIKVITAIVLLNGLNDPDALALQEIATVRHIHHPDSAGKEEAGIPVHLSFMARTAVSSLDKRDCAVCKLHRRYASIPSLAPLPARLEQQRTWLLRSLDPRSKQRVYEEEATDLLGMHIGQEDCVEYLRWKYRFTEAALDTRRRRDVVTMLTAAADRPILRDAVVRLLVAESHWLMAAPLRFPTVTDTVAALASSLVLGDAARAADPVLRVQAVILLANADPDQFIAKIRPLALASLDQPIVLGQVLLEAFRMLIVDGMSSSTDDSRVQSLMQNLISLERRLRERPQTISAGPEVPIPVPEIRYLVSHGRRALQPAPTDPQGAWDALGLYWMSVSEHSHDAAMWRLEIMLTNLARGAPPRKPDLLRKDWQRCKDFLLLEVMPNVRSLHSLLVSHRATQELTSEEAIQWHQIVSGDGPRQLDQISIMLDAILTDAGARSTNDEQVEVLATQLGWWNRFFLATHVDPGESDRSAFLTEIIRRCPVNVIEAVRDVFEHSDHDIHAPRTDGDDMALLAFCTSDLLRDVLTHVRSNAEITHRASDEPQQFLIVVTVVSRNLEDDVIRICVFNTGSAPSKRGGKKGMTALREELKAFSATLETIEFEPPWTFGVSVTVERWRMS